MAVENVGRKTSMKNFQGFSNQKKKKRVKESRQGSHCAIVFVKEW